MLSKPPAQVVRFEDRPPRGYLRELPWSRPHTQDPRGSFKSQAQAGRGGQIKAQTVRTGLNLGPGEGEQIAKVGWKGTSSLETVFTTATSGDSTPLTELPRLSPASGPPRRGPRLAPPPAAAAPGDARGEHGAPIGRTGPRAARLRWKASPRTRRCWRAAPRALPKARTHAPVWWAQRGDPGPSLRAPTVPAEKRQVSDPLPAAPE